MNTQLLAINYSEPLWVAIAFLFGLCVRLIGLPPMVGFLIAGFALSALGAQSGTFLHAIADLGITLLLFSIGLKLKLKSLTRLAVWGVASVHIVIITLCIASFVLVLSLLGLPLLVAVDLHTALLIGFALSFSSTVFAVKILDDFGATNTTHGKIAIGVLVVQDITAVVFIAVSMGTLPSIWAFALLALLPVRFVLFKLLEQVGHGELLILFGITLALIGAYLFTMVGMKGGVGALVVGMLLANHPKATELAKSLLGFKDLFLVGFFLSVGMTGVPGWSEVIIGLLFLFILPIKMALYFGLFNLFYVQTSSSWRTSFHLASYSEFGLIVGMLAASAGWLPKEWLIVFAVVMFGSFILLAPFTNVRDNLYQRWHPLLKYLERTKSTHPEVHLHLAPIKVVVLGMGRLGSAAYSAMEQQYAESLIGIEIEPERVHRHKKTGKQVIAGDVTSIEFWENEPELLQGLEWVLLTLPTHTANINAALRLKEVGYTGRIAATTRYADEENALKVIGVAHTFNVYAEAGLGFANDLLHNQIATDAINMKTS